MALGLAFVLMQSGLWTPSLHAQTLTVLHEFNGTDGAYPNGNLLLDKSGNLYGTTDNGGPFSAGTVYKLSSKRKETVLHNFTGGTTDGQFPAAGLVQDKSGILYGTTYYGGGDSSCNPFYQGCGTVFSLQHSKAKWEETVLYSFSGGTDGGEPFYGILVRGPSGKLYGTTEIGGSFGAGTVYELSTNGQENVLYNFTGGADGGYPFQGLVRDADGNLYGTTNYGGDSNCSAGFEPGCGVVFELTKGGTFKVLYSFTGGTSDGALPSGLFRDNKGNLYGTTCCGGTFSQGTVWKLDKTGKETILYNFQGGNSDGSTPAAGVIRDAAGNLYGTTEHGGAGQCEAGCGTIFKLDPSGKETVLHSFNGSDGAFPFGELIEDEKGDIYGTATEGGPTNYGTVWKLAP
jgi:uncharacterized repeat protein (TIGR03803 family)